MEKIAFIVDRLNMPPFNKGFSTMTEFDSTLGMELMDLACEVVATIDPEQSDLMKELMEMKGRRIIQFLLVMKFSIAEDQLEDFQNMTISCDKEILHNIIHWCLQRFDALQKRAYLAKYLMPIDIPPEFMDDNLVVELSQHLKELQQDFKEVHKVADKLNINSSRPNELKAEIAQLEQERSQLKNKIQRMKKDAPDESDFEYMLKVTSALRKEQEEEVKTYDRLRELREGLQDVEQRYCNTAKRFTELRSSGVQSQTAEQILSKLQKDVRELMDKRDAIESMIADREMHLEKLQGWDNNDRNATEDDVRVKRGQVREVEEQIASLQQRLDDALDRNNRLVTFRQASTMALKKLREQEEQVEKLTDEKCRLQRVTEEKEAAIQAQGRGGPDAVKMRKKDMEKFGVAVKKKIVDYKRMREELSQLRAELVVLQRTDAILKSRNKNLDEFFAEMEKKKGVQGYRDTQRALIEMSEKAAGVDQIKGETLEEISHMVENITREFKARQTQLMPLINELKKTRVEYGELENEYNERKGHYDKVAVGLDIEKRSLEKDCDNFQDECLQEESRYHYLSTLLSLARIRQDRSDQEKKWQANDGRMMRDFACLKDLYANKLGQQEQMKQQLRKRQKELKENSEAMSNQKTNFLNLQVLLDSRLKIEQGQSISSTYQGGGKPVETEAKVVVRADVMSFDD